jgi:hypothetical protein
MQTGKHPSFLLAVLLCGCVCTQASAHSGHPQHRAHQHGVAELQVAVDGPSLVVRLDSPLDNRAHQHGVAARLRACPPQ